MARVCVVGSVNLDQSFTVRSLPRPGEAILASSSSHSPGASVQLVAALGDVLNAE